MSTKTNTATKTAKSTANKVAKVTKPEVSKADQALEIVQRVFSNKIEGQSSRQRVLAELETIGLTAPTARQTYFQNALTKLRNQDAEAVTKALEKNKPVWSVVKVDTYNQVTAVGLFVSASKAKEFNETYEHHAVVKGVVQLGEAIDEKLIKKVPKAPRQPKVEVAAKKTAVKAKVATKKAAVAKSGKASTKKAA